MNLCLKQKLQARGMFQLSCCICSLKKPEYGVQLFNFHLRNYSHETERQHKCSFLGCDYREKMAYTLSQHVKKDDGEWRSQGEIPLSTLLQTCLGQTQLYNHIPFHTKEKSSHAPIAALSPVMQAILNVDARRHAKQSDEATGAKIHWRLTKESLRIQIADENT